MERFECNDIAALLSGLLDGELDEATRHRAEAHLAECTDCRKVLQDAEQLDLMTSALMDVYESGGTGRLEERVMHAIGSEDGAGPAPIPFRPRERRLAIAAVGGWLSAAAAIVLAGVLFVQARDAASTPDDSGLASGGSDDSTEVVHDEIPAANESNEKELPDDQFAANESEDESSPLRDPESATPDVAANENAVPGGDDRVAINEEDENRSSEHRVASRVVVDPFSAMEHAVAMAPALEAEIETERQARANARRRAEEAERRARAREEADRLAREQEQAERLASARDREVDPYGPSNTLYQAATALQVLQQADTDSFRDINLIREAIESDDLVNRLAEVRDALGYDPEPAETVRSAWAALEWVNGRMESDEIQVMKDALERSNLPARLEDLSDQFVD